MIHRMNISEVSFITNSNEKKPFRQNQNSNQYKLKIEIIHFCPISLDQ